MSLIASMLKPKDTVNYTEFAVLDIEELLSYVLTRANITSLEVELGQRLQVAVDVIFDLQEQLLAYTTANKGGLDCGDDTRSEGKKLC